MDESEIKKIMKQVPSKKPSGEFTDDLFERLQDRAELMYERSNKKSQKSILFPWKMSLAFASFCFILIFSFILFLSPEVKQRLEGYVDQDALSALSDEIPVEIVGLDDDMVLFVYDVEHEGSPPLDVDILVSNNTATFNLNVGEYRILVVEDGEIVFEENVDVEIKSDPIELKI